MPLLKNGGITDWFRGVESTPELWQEAEMPGYKMRHGGQITLYTVSGARLVATLLRKVKAPCDQCKMLSLLTDEGALENTSRILRPWIP